jgi:hypothetical protein
VDADVSASAAIAASKLAATLDLSSKTVTLPDASVSLAKLSAPQYTGFRNAIINGNYDIWQRGTSVTGAANDQYVADRWYTSRAGSTVNVTRQAFTTGQSDVPNEPSYFHRSAVTSVAGAGNNAALSQRIEDVRTFAGQNITISFYAKADAARPISVDLFQSFGSGGSPSSGVFLSPTKTTLSTSWQKITVTAAVPSISGKTIGSDNNSRLTLSIWLDAGSNFNSRTDTLGQQSGTFDIAQVQIEQGSVATPFEARPIGTELALCQRYFEIADVTIQSPAAQTMAFPCTFAVAKRANPTMATISVGADVNVTSATFTNLKQSSVSLQLLVSAAAGYRESWKFSASAEL